MGTSHRPQRTASLVRAELARLLCHEVSDPRLRSAVITDVTLSPDLKAARVYYGSEGGGSKDMRHGFKRATPFLRKRLAENLTMRWVPELDFKFDEHGENVNRLMSLMDKLEVGGEVVVEES